jgi:ribosome-binding protein aMBF1 (putative translation factor)
MITCDLCGKAKDCLQKEIDGKEYDVCRECWNPLAQKLKGKGRDKRYREMVLLPPRLAPEQEEKEPELPPRKPPIIQGDARIC